MVGAVYNSSTHDRTSGSYWNIETSGQNTSKCGLGLTTEQMKQQTIYGWNFNTIWIMGEDGYPKLR